MAAARIRSVRLTPLLLLLLLPCALSRRYHKCELAEELATVHGMTPREVQEWVCIAEFESTFNTAAVNKHNWDGSYDYGLFQLSNKFWCRDHYGGKDACRMPCEDLLDDDITDDLKCIALIIEETERWKGPGTALTAWVAYVNRCQGRNLTEYMMDCPASHDSPVSNLIPRVDPTKGDEKVPQGPSLNIEDPKQASQANVQNNNLIATESVKNAADFDKGETALVEDNLSSNKIKATVDDSPHAQVPHPSQDSLHVRDLTAASQESSPADNRVYWKTVAELVPAYYRGMLIPNLVNLKPALAPTIPLLYTYSALEKTQLKKRTIGSEKSGLHLSVYEEV